MLVVGIVISAFLLWLGPRNALLALHTESAVKLLGRCPGILPGSVAAHTGNG